MENGRIKRPDHTENESDRVYCFMERKEKRISLKRRIIIIFLFFTMALVLVSGFYLASMADESKRRLIKNQQSTLEAFVTDLQYEQGNAEITMSDIVLRNANFRHLLSISDKDEIYLNSIEIRVVLKSMLDANENITASMVYNSENDILVSTIDEVYGDTELEKLVTKRAIEESMRKLFNTGPIPSGKWFAKYIEGRFYFVRVLKEGQEYISTLIDVDLAVQRFMTANQVTGDMEILDDEIKLTLGEDFISEHSWTDGVAIDTELLKNNIIVKTMMDDYTVAYQENYVTISFIGTVLNYIVLFLLILGLLITITMFVYVTRTVFKPLDGLVSTMEKIGKGELTAQSDTGYVNEEFKQVNDTFNQMISQIKALKIESYEKELDSQRNAMTALRMQIRPHFVENCLKNLYALARQNKTEDVKSLILALSKHLRYILTYEADTVSLSKELELCDNYCQLSSIGQPDNMRIIYEQDMDGDLSDFRIPIVSILSLIENSVKHRSASKQTIIRVTARAMVMEYDRLVNISISDNGKGFDEEQLKKLNSKDFIPSEDKHVGLYNMINRFKLIYGDRFTIAFTNATEGGAKIEIFIINSGEENETFNC